MSASFGIDQSFPSRSRPRPRGPAYTGGPSRLSWRAVAEPGQDHRVLDVTRGTMEKTYAAIRDELVMTLAAGGFGAKAAAIVDALEKLMEARIEVTRGRRWVEQGRCTEPGARRAPSG